MGTRWKLETRATRVAPTTVGTVVQTVWSYHDSGVPQGRCSSTLKRTPLGTTNPCPSTNPRGARRRYFLCDDEDVPSLSTQHVPSCLRLVGGPRVSSAWRRNDVPAVRVRTGTRTVRGRVGGRRTHQGLAVWRRPHTDHASFLAIGSRSNDCKRSCLRHVSHLGGRDRASTRVSRRRRSRRDGRTTRPPETPSRRSDAAYPAGPRVSLWDTRGHGSNAKGPFQS